LFRRVIRTSGGYTQSMPVLLGEEERSVWVTLETASSAEGTVS